MMKFFAKSVSKLAEVTNKIYNDFYCRPISLKLTQFE